MQDMTIAEEREYELRRDVTREATELWLSQAHELLHAASDIELVYWFSVSCENEASV